MSDETLEKALKLLDEGKTPAEILNAFQEDKLELEAIFSLLGHLKTEAKKIELPRELRSKIKHSLLSNNLDAKPKFNFIEKIQGKLKFIIPCLAATAVMLTILLPKNIESPIIKETKLSGLANNQETNHIDETANQIITDFTSDNPYIASSDEEINSIQKSYSEYNINDIYNEETF